VNLRDIEQAIADEKARIDAAHAAVAEAREALERAEKAQIEATLRAEARIVALEAAAQLFAEEGLHPKSVRTNIAPNMQPHTEPARRNRRGRPTVAKHPFPQALERHVPPLTLTAWAKKHRVEREVAKSWFASGDGGRRIPREMAEKIEAELGVPATLAVWKNGIRQ